jgi:glutamate N-acetyltransferase/amino-acid N-acetyltransferase
MTIGIPRGFSLSAVHCGLKRDADKPDLSLVVSDRPAVAAGVYTQNLVYAAPVAWDRQHTPSESLRAVVINAGNANACTGERGLADAREMARLAAAACGAQAEQALVLSTGVIGAYLPMEKITAGIRAAAQRLGNDPPALLAAADGMLTTDTVRKLSGRTITVLGQTVQITGLAKGAAMMGPNMATMLSLLLTDAALTAADAQAALAAAVDDSFNCMSVEGHTSTNDSVLLVANGAAGGPPLTGPGLAAFRGALGEVCAELARAIPADGEGATHLVTLQLSGCADRPSALRIAKAIANSALVKTAIHGADPNWGRIVSAAGCAGVPFDPRNVGLRLNGFPLYQAGAPVPFDAAAVSRSLRDNRETVVELDLGSGPAALRFWTCDLTAEYVRLNADYHT